MGRLKLRDPEVLRALVAEGGLLPPPPDALVLDTAAFPPTETARRIAAHAGALS